jgi:hypothetical protein
MREIRGLAFFLVIKAHPERAARRSENITQFLANPDISNISTSTSVVVAAINFPDTDTAFVMRFPGVPGVHFLFNANANKNFVQQPSRQLIGAAADFQTSTIFLFLFSKHLFSAYHYHYH